jgi:histidine triad (HIT) family protein
LHDCIFCKIASEKSVPLVYEDHEIAAFNDAHPQAPVHILVVPKRHIDSLDMASGSDRDLLGNMLLVIQKIAREKGIADSGYRTVINCNRGAGQTIFHLHMHLIGGRYYSERMR